MQLSPPWKPSRSIASLSEERASYARRKDRRKTLMGASVLLLTMVASTASCEELTGSEIAAIQSYVEGISTPEDIRRNVGQLLILGVPADVRNANETRTTDLIAKRGVGGIFLASYLYAGMDGTTAVHVNAAINLHNMLQLSALDSPAGLPLFLAGDAEIPSLSSFETLLSIDPVEPLTLSATEDGQLIRQNGQLLGHQLHALGVNMIMSPVLDRAKKLETRPDLSTRTFAEENDRVVTAAAHFVAGLNDSPILTIGKHYPGLGSLSVGSNLHVIADAPRITAGANTLDENIVPYRQLKGMLGGLMTAHVSVKQLTGRDDDMVTFSSRIVKNLLRGEGEILMEGGAKVTAPGFKTELVVTDDLSNMGPIIYRMHCAEGSNRMSFGDVAWNAFQAGHDLLLFAHMETRNRSDAVGIDCTDRRGNNIVEVGGWRKRGLFAAFHYEDAIEVLDRLTIEISRSDSAKQQFKDSLVRILRAKAQLAKQLDSHVEDLLHRRATFRVTNSTPEALATLRVTEDGKTHNVDGNAIIEQTMRAAFTWFSDGDPPSLDLNELSSRDRVTFFVEGSMLDVYQKEIPGNNSWTWIALPEERARIAEQLKSQVLEAFRASEIVVYTVRKIDDLDAINFARLNVGDRVIKQKSRVMLHTSPYLLDRTDEMLPFINVFGTMSHHRESYRADARALTGQSRELGKVSKVSVKFADHRPLDYGNKISLPEAITAIKMVRNTPLAQALSENELLKKTVMELQEKLHSAESTGARALKIADPEKARLRDQWRVATAASVLSGIFVLAVVLPPIRYLKRSAGWAILRWPRTWGSRPSAGADDWAIRLLVTAMCLALSLAVLAGFPPWISAILVATLFLERALAAYNAGMKERESKIVENRDLWESLTATETRLYMLGLLAMLALAAVLGGLTFKDVMDAVPGLGD